MCIKCFLPPAIEIDDKLQWKDFDREGEKGFGYIFSSIKFKIDDENSRLETSEKVELYTVKESRFIPKSLQKSIKYQIIST